MAKKLEMQIKTKAIVLHTVKCSENSVIVHTYTEQHGRMSYVVNGVKSKRSSLRSSFLQPLMVLELDTDYNPNKDLQRIKESRVAYTFTDLPYDPSKNALAIFIAELLYRSLKEPHTDPELFQFIYDSIEKLDTSENGVGNFHLSFLMQYSRHMGFAPQHDTYIDNAHFDMQNGVFLSSRPSFGNCLSNYDSRLFATICTINYGNMHGYSFTREDKKALLKNLMSYYKLHMHHFSHIKSLDVLYQLFA